MSATAGEPIGEIWAVIPIKNMEDAKTRLAPDLSPAERRGLFEAMAEDVIAAARTSQGVARTLILSNDARARELAVRYGCDVASEPANIGQSEAVARAAAIAMEAGAEGVLTLPADAPLATADEIASVIARHPNARPAITIVPDHARRGSNCLVLTPGDLIPLHFGHTSFEPHLAEVAKLGLQANILDDLPGIALDIDTADDLKQALATGLASRAMEFARTRGIAARLGAGPS